MRTFVSRKRAWEFNHWSTVSRVPLSLSLIDPYLCESSRSRKNQQTTKKHEKLPRMQRVHRLILSVIKLSIISTPYFTPACDTIFTRFGNFVSIRNAKTAIVCQIYIYSVGGVILSHVSPGSAPALTFF